MWAAASGDSRGQTHSEPQLTCHQVPSGRGPGLGMSVSSAWEPEVCRGGLSLEAEGKLKSTCGNTLEGASGMGQRPQDQHSGRRGP